MASAYDVASGVESTTSNGYLSLRLIWAKSIRCLYRLCWQVESLFKEWKSYANVKPYCTRKPAVAEGLIWAALCAVLLKRYLAHAAQAAAGGVEVSTRIAAMSLSHHLPGVIDVSLSGRALRPPLEALLESVAKSCLRETGRARVNCRRAAFWKGTS